MRILHAVAVAAVIGLASPAAQTPAPSATGVLAGQLVAAGTDAPVRKASVRLTRIAPGVTRTTTSDEHGRFAFTDLPAGDYRLTATRPGFLDSVYGARQPGTTSAGTPIQLGEGQRIDTLTMAMPRGGAISGIVTDEYGDPAFNVPVRALLYGYRNGERVVTTSGNAVTDDRGAYRLAGLLPGEYLVSALPRDSVSALAAQANAAQQAVQQRMAQAIATGDERMMATAKADAARMGPPPPPPSPTGYVPVYYPGVAQASTARVVRIGLSEEAWNIDFSLEIMETASLLGTVTNIEGPLPLDTRVQLIDPTLPVAGVGVWFRNTNSAGAFDFHGVAPGSYVLRAHATLPPQEGGATLTAATTVTVAPGDRTEAALLLRPGVTITGRIALGPLPDTVDRSTLLVSLSPITTSADWEMAAPRGVVNADGTFAIPHVVPGRYRPSLAGLPDGWTIDSATFDRVDAADLHLHVDYDRTYTGEITLTNRTASVRGALTDADGTPASTHTVVIFPNDRAMWVPQSRRIVVTRPDRDGRYTIGPLPPGEYHLAAVLDPEPGREFDAVWLSDLLSQSLRVTLARGEQRSLDLRVR